MQLVENSKAELESIQAELDAAAGKADGTTAAERKVSGDASEAVEGVRSWYVDTESNTVHVTVAEGEGKEAAAELASYGDAVSIEETDLVPRTTANYMDGGDEINGATCSAGFNLRNPSTGQGYLLTAGHCQSAGSTLSGQGGVNFGPVLESWFPTFDDSIARNDSAGYWIQGPWVDYNPSNGGYINTYGYTDAPIGTWICKAGITTKWTCGQITGKNETVTYSRQPHGLRPHAAQRLRRARRLRRRQRLGDQLLRRRGRDQRRVDDLGRLPLPLPLRVRPRERVVVLPDRQEPGLLRPEVRGHGLVVA